MKYYPKSKVLENQYTSGKEFVIKSNNQSYIGYYYSLSNNTFFTGKTSEDKNTVELILLNVIKKESILLSYDKLNSTFNGSFTTPIPYYPVPTDNDYKMGFISRYFVKKRNSSYTTIVEISPDTYNTYFSNTSILDTNLYAAVKINWKISGTLNNDFSDVNFPKIGIIETNQKLVQLKEKVFPGFSLFFKDYSQYSKKG